MIHKGRILLRHLDVRRNGAVHDAEPYNTTRFPQGHVAGQVLY